MKTPQQIKNEVEKGCGKDIIQYSDKCKYCGKITTRFLIILRGKNRK